MTIDTRIHPADRYFTSHEVGVILQVTPGSVVKWINEGLLNAFRTPGGHRRVAATELVRFSLEHGIPIPEALRELAIAKVLVVDDEPRFLSALQRSFKPYANEVRVDTVENGVDALIAIGALKPDVLVLDIRMPGLNGLEVMERLRANEGTKRMVVVAISGQMDAITTARCKQLGAAACLEKPVDLGKILAIVRELRKPRSSWSR